MLRGTCRATCCAEYVAEYVAQRAYRTARCIHIPRMHSLTSKRYNWLDVDIFWGLQHTHARYYKFSGFVFVCVGCIYHSKSTHLPFKIKTPLTCKVRPAVLFSSPPRRVRTLCGRSATDKVASLPHCTAGVKSLTCQIDEQRQARCDVSDRRPTDV